MLKSGSRIRHYSGREYILLESAGRFFLLSEETPECPRYVVVSRMLRQRSGSYKWGVCYHFRDDFQHARQFLSSRKSGPGDFM